MLRLNNYDVRYFDCVGMDYHEQKEIVEPPLPLRHYKRKYNRFGIRRKSIQAMFRHLDRTPDCIFITSGMTYWYPGLQEVIGYCRHYYPDVKICLGGTYATLEPAHAMSLGVDYVVRGEGENECLSVASSVTGHCISRTVNLKDLDSIPLPAWDLTGKLRNRAFKGGYLPLYSSRGCPYDCSYCASKVTYTCGFRQKSVDRFFCEVLQYIKDYRCYCYTLNDDNLLVNKDRHIKPILEKFISSGIGKRLKIQTPNSTSAEQYDQELADLMKLSGFKRICLSIEVLSEREQQNMKRQSRSDDVRRAVGFLHKAGYRRSDIIVYILTGLPGQTIQSCIETVLFVWKIGALPMPLTFVPLRGTLEWERCIERGDFTEDVDPIIFTKGIVSMQSGSLTYDDGMWLKYWSNRIRTSMMMGVDVFADDSRMAYARTVMVEWESKGLTRSVDIHDKYIARSDDIKPGALLKGLEQGVSGFGDRQSVGDKGKRFKSGFVKGDKYIYALPEILMNAVGVSASTLKRLDVVLSPVIKKGVRYYSPESVMKIDEIIRLYSKGLRGRKLIAAVLSL